ncbi:MAG: endonuclease MutS2 [Erysipelotrichaceae bacterium]|uniref:endonuclease MutS2 n=1 Tax=Floccifex sp. TaxID=2815810 RepID=UPI002A764C4B|nr:endonuclease MutS2 [Floccifex sp.]MDD7281580.1 endonuclease MutS2 [Erysipelotrichaceae bacterium]MDY2958163.1 endonuclease MutS2 [Floccifex sp.]
MSYKNFSEKLNKAIDFDRVLGKIAEYASFSCSKEEIINALPYRDRLKIQRELDYVSEALEFVRKGETISFAGCMDISYSVNKANKKMSCTPQELYEIALFLVTVKNVRETLLKSETKLLKDLAESMDVCANLYKDIQKQIDATGNVKMDATVKLKSLHKQLVDTRLSLNERARAFMKKNADSLMEVMTTTINGRLSVLVKNQDKNRFGGMIHASSQSGQASYVEPDCFISLNNELARTQSEIEEETARICRELSQKVASFAMPILSDLETMTILDVAFAKARWAYEHEGCVPTIRLSQRNLLLERARHPLIDEKKCVANTYALKQEQNCLMISGPNMGGKTVTLKTIGLFVALSHAGFPVLCDRALIPFYDSIWFDIGDNQSIENNLSTFSSHISNIANICQNVSNHSFVLLDEVGNGTDPLEGASLAISILEYLIEKGCTVITSTHYSQVKSFGKANDHVLVSSVEFDSQTLQPTYKYIPGVSGASYAFLIAHNYHLPDSIIQRADEYKKDNEQDVQRQLEKLEKLQNDVLVDKERFNKMIKQAHQIQKDAYQEKEKWEKKNKELQEEYEQRLHDMLEEKENEANEIIQTLKKQKTGKLHEQSEALHQIHVLQQENTQEEEKQADESLKVGDYVQIESLNSHGEILDIRKKEATVLVNGMKMKVKLNRLKRIQKPNVQKVPKKVHQDRNFTRFPLELNLIGMRVEEAIQELDRYIDQAIYHKVKQVRIIHGMGTGALRSAVWKDLDKHPMVVSKMSAGPNEGGLGATVVLLK